MLYAACSEGFYIKTSGEVTDLYDIAYVGSMKRKMNCCIAVQCIDMLTKQREFISYRVLWGRGLLLPENLTKSYIKS